MERMTINATNSMRVTICYTFKPITCQLTCTIINIISNIHAPIGPMPYYKSGIHLNISLINMSLMI